MSSRRTRKSKSHKGDLLRLDPADVAEQLCLMDYALYAKIRPQECYSWVKTQSGPTVTNLLSFCSSHDRLAAWVKSSILSIDAVPRRADTVDFWIKVTEVGISLIAIVEVELMGPPEMSKLAKLCLDERTPFGSRQRNPFTTPLNMGSRKPRVQSSASAKIQRSKRRVRSLPQPTPSCRRLLCPIHRDVLD